MRLMSLRVWVLEYVAKVHRTLRCTTSARGRDAVRWMVPELGKQSVFVSATPGSSGSHSIKWVDGNLLCCSTCNVLLRCHIAVVGAHHRVRRRMHCRQATLVHLTADDGPYVHTCRTCAVHGAAPNVPPPRIFQSSWGTSPALFPQPLRRHLQLLVTVLRLRRAPLPYRSRGGRDSTATVLLLSCHPFAEPGSPSGEISYSRVNAHEVSKWR